MSDLLNSVGDDYISTLPLQQQEQIKQIANKINIKNTQSVVEFGTEIQYKLLQFSNQLAKEIHDSDTLNVGQILSELLTKVSQFDTDDVTGRRKGIFSRFLPPTRPSQKLISKYQRMGIEVDYISTRLEKEGKLLEKEIHMLEKMYEMNKEYYTSISKYIAAGKYKKQEIENNELPALQNRLVHANLLEKEEISDLNRFLHLLDKRLYDLELSQQISFQKAPQIRMIQENHRILLDKIQSSILNTIPLWKDQFIMGLTLERQSQAISTQRKVSNTTNDLILKSAKNLSTSNVNVSKENALGLTDLETISQSMHQLLQTIDEVKMIQASGRTKQQSIEQELLRLDSELKHYIDNK